MFPAGGKPKKSSIITSTFQGELQVTTLAGTGKGAAAAAAADVVERVPFMLMGLELPPTPLFKDALEKNIIPQVGFSQVSCSVAVELLLLIGSAVWCTMFQQQVCMLRTVWQACYCCWLLYLYSESVRLDPISW